MSRSGLGSAVAAPIISFRDFSFTYLGSSKRALSDVNLEIGEGDVVVLAGPSGCGKSTLLRSINGLIPHMHPGEYRGGVVVDGSEVAVSSVSSMATRVGFVFQNPENQIFMFTVERDVAFGLENLGFPREEIRERVRWALDIMEIGHLSLRQPHTLSDGQKQRVALAGVLAVRPRILILDEPTSLLDPYAAAELIDLIERLHRSLNLTVLIVEHRLDLVSKIASKIAVLYEGKVSRLGEPREVLSDPEAPLMGVGVPTISRLHLLLRDRGLDQVPLTLGVEELSNWLNARLVSG